MAVIDMDFAKNVYVDRIAKPTTSGTFSTYVMTTNININGAGYIVVGFPEYLKADNIRIDSLGTNELYGYALTPRGLIYLSSDDVRGSEIVGLFAVSSTPRALNITISYTVVND